MANLIFLKGVPAVFHADLFQLQHIVSVDYSVTTSCKESVNSFPAPLNYTYVYSIDAVTCHLDL